MKPTSRLRFVERKVPIFGSVMSDGMGGTVSTKQNVRVLQQWWEDKPGDYEEGVTAFGEWRDVPLEAEE